MILKRTLIASITALLLSLTMPTPALAASPSDGTVFELHDIAFLNLETPVSLRAELVIKRQIPETSYFADVSSLNLGTFANITSIDSLTPGYGKIFIPHQAFKRADAPMMICVRIYLKRSRTITESCFDAGAPNDFATATHQRQIFKTSNATLPTISVNYSYFPVSLEAIDPKAPQNSPLYVLEISRLDLPEGGLGQYANRKDLGVAFSLAQEDLALMNAFVDDVASSHRQSVLDTQNSPPAFKGFTAYLSLETYRDDYLLTVSHVHSPDQLPAGVQFNLSTWNRRLINASTLAEFSQNHGPHILMEFPETASRFNRLRPTNAHVRIFEAVRCDD